jgi:hypothetical protein
MPSEQLGKTLMPFTRKLLGRLLTLSVLAIGGCMKTMIVEAKDVKFFEIKDALAPSGRVVKIKGLVFHSSLAVDHVDIQRSGENVTISVILTPARTGLSGSFTLEVPLAKDEKRILFGPSKVQIWSID